MRQRFISLAGAVVALSTMAGCSRAPSISIVGSFFPVWMICLIVGVVVAFFARASLVRWKLEEDMKPLWLFYPATVILTASIVWLILFR